MIHKFRQEKDISACGILGIINENGEKFNGEVVIRGMKVMQERSNGLGAGFAGYGIYPQYKNFYAFHFLFDNNKIRSDVEDFLISKGVIAMSEPIPTEKLANVRNPPIVWRIFFNPKESKKFTQDEQVVQLVMEINERFDGAFVMSSGKDMGIFKGNGWSHEIAEFYQLKDYEAYMWIGHNRFPTNTPGWWGGAHPFGLLSVSIVHNGEISSYGINKRYLENFGYKCNLFTDTEVICYLWDLFLRQHKLDIHTISKIIAAPFWSEIDHMPKKERDFYTKLRMIYGSALLNGPFGIIVGMDGQMLGLNDRLKLRPLVCARANEHFYIASEEAAIREAANFNNLEEIRSPKGGELVIGRVKNGKI